MLNSTESAQIIPGCEDRNQNIQGHATKFNENPDIEKLMDDNFLVIDADCSKKTGNARRNPKKMCLHCSWEATGTRTFFVDHILQKSSLAQAGRKCCDYVPDDI